MFELQLQCFIYLHLLMKIVIAPDKYKESLSASEVASSIEKGIRQSMPDSEIVAIPLADGGDGTAEAIICATHGKWKYVKTVDPLHREIRAKYGIINNDTVVFDIATASGLALLKTEDRNPMTTDSFGSGLIIKNAIQHGYRKFIIGVGGSATNDAATGLLTALGFRFLDRQGNCIQPCGGFLSAIREINDKHCLPELSDCSLTVLCDVTANFYGNYGASQIFARQKGANDVEIAKLDKGMASFANILKKFTGKDVQTQQYAGAAGGIAGGLWGLLNATLTQGIFPILELIKFDNILSNTDLVITGEGHIDRQTLLGKTPFGVCQKAQQYGIPTIAFAGCVSDKDALIDAGFKDVVCIHPKPLPLRDAINPTTTRNHLQAAAQNLIVSFFRDKQKPVK